MPWFSCLWLSQAQFGPLIKAFIMNDSHSPLIPLIGIGVFLVLLWFLLEVLRHLLG